MWKSLQSSPRQPVGFRSVREARERRKRVAIALLVALIIMVLLRTPLFNALSSAANIVARPLWGAHYAAGGLWGNIGALLSSKLALNEENERLNHALDLLVLESLSRDALRRENEELRALMGREEQTARTLARVLSGPARSPYDTLVIDIGEDHALVRGMRVFIDGDFAIGEVERVSGRSSVVRLYSSYGNELDVTVGTSSTPAKARGEGGGNFHIALPKGVEVIVGDLVQIPTFAPEYAGVVEAIDRPEGSSLQDIYVKLPFNIHELNWVLVDTVRPIDGDAAIVQ